MASKKYTTLIGLLCLLVSGAFAQEQGGFNPQDSSVIPARRLPQHTEFMANNYPFPAKPRSQWELGLKVGAYSISGDVRSRFPGFGAGLHVRKALGYVFSLRGEVAYGNTKGLNFQPSRNYTKNVAWNDYTFFGAPGGPTPTQSIFYNYKAENWDLSLQGVVTLNNIRFHKSKSGFNIYAFAGIGAMINKTKIDALNGNAVYDFSPIIAKYQGNGFAYKDRRNIRSDLKDLLDGSYETNSEDPSGKPQLFGEPLNFMVIESQTESGY
jgi:OmpA-OmpF porin, OOP family